MRSSTQGEAVVQEQRDSPWQLIYICRFWHPPAARFCMVTHSRRVQRSTRTGCEPSLRLVVYRCIWLTIVLRQPKDDAMVFISTCAKEEHSSAKGLQAATARRASTVHTPSNGVLPASEYPPCAHALCTRRSQHTRASVLAACKSAALGMTAQALPRVRLAMTACARLHERAAGLVEHVVRPVDGEHSLLNAPRLPQPMRLLEDAQETCLQASREVLFETHDEHRQSQLAISHDGIAAEAVCQAPCHDSAWPGNPVSMSADNPQLRPRELVDIEDAMPCDLAAFHGLQHCGPKAPTGDELSFMDAHLTKNGSVRTVNSSYSAAAARVASR